MIYLTLPFPPSINGYWRAYQGRQIISKRGREYRACVLKQMLQERVPCFECELEVHLTLCPPDKRKRDIDNYTKAVFDALSHASFWRDDSLVKRLTIVMSSPIKQGRVNMVVQPLVKELDK